MSSVQSAGTTLARAVVAERRQLGRSKRGRQCAACGKPCPNGQTVTRVEFVSRTSILADLHFACSPKCAGEIAANVRFASNAEGATE